MPKEKFVYEDAVKELQQIVSDMEQNKIPFSALAGTVKRAGELIAACRNELRKSEEQIVKSMEKQQDA